MVISLRQELLKLTEGSTPKVYYSNEQYEAQDELKNLLLGIEAFEAIGDIRTRDRYVIQSVATARHCGFQSGFRKVGDIVSGKVHEVTSRKKPDWAGDIIAYIVLPQGQIAYFLSNSDMVEHDGHSREEKLQRINEFIG